MAKSSYTNDGSFKNISQVQNTPVIILTYGNNRTLKWQRVAHSSNSWVRDQNWTTQSMTMNDSSYMLLHPHDEKPHYNSLIGKKIRYQHGNVRMKKNDSMSIAIVFRVVSTYKTYNIGTNLMQNTAYNENNNNASETKKLIERQKVYDQLSKILLFEKNIRIQYNTIRNI